jgi:hypothetical protein
MSEKIVEKRLSEIAGMITRREGWGWLSNSPKWHYFVDGRSLCGRWLGLGLGELEQGMDNSPDNCAECRRRVVKRKVDLEANQK